MIEPPTDFKALVDEATKTTYDPRGRRCWPWSHHWTMWNTEPAGRFQIRRCVGCGKEQRHELVAICTHDWFTVREGPVLAEGKGDIPIAHFHDQTCLRCGELRHKRLGGTYGS